MKLKEALKTNPAILDGILARKPVPFSLRPGPLPVATQNADGSWTYPTEAGVFFVDVRPLTSLEEAEALSKARAFAVERGVKEPREGDPVYDRAVRTFFVAASCVDHESPKEAPEAFCTAEDAWKLDGERIALLYEQQVAWQDEISPRRLTLSEAEYVGYMTALAVAGEDLPFDLVPLATQRACLRISARQLFGSPTPKSQPTSDSAPSKSSDNPTPPEPAEVATESGEP